MQARGGTQQRQVIQDEEQEGRGSLPRQRMVEKEI